jgi:hypothetical protein
MFQRLAAAPAVGILLVLSSTSSTTDSANKPRITAVPTTITIWSPRGSLAEADLGMGYDIDLDEVRFDCLTTDSASNPGVRV